MIFANNHEKKDVVEHGVLYASTLFFAYRTLCSTTQSLVDIGDFFSAFYN